MILPHAIHTRAGLVRESGGSNDGPVQSAVCEYVLHLGCIRQQIREKQPAGKIRRRDDRVLEQERHRYGNDALDSRVPHRIREDVCEVLQKVGIIFRDGRPWTKARRNGVLFGHHLLELMAVQQIALNDSDPAVQILQPPARSHECRDGVTVFHCLANDRLPNTARSTQYQDSHNASDLSMGPYGLMARGTLRGTIPWKNPDAVAMAITARD